MMESILNFFVSSAYAAPAAQAPASQGSGLGFMIFVFGFGIIYFYFVMLRPQNKRAKEQQNLMSSLAKGDEVITTGGLLGRITKITDQYVGLALANNVEILAQRTSVSSILPKGTLKSLDK